MVDAEVVYLSFMLNSSQIWVANFRTHDNNDFRQYLICNYETHRLR